MSIKTGRKFQIGEQVECNGNKNAVIDRYYGDMYEVKLFSGCRLVGGVCVGETEIKKLRS